MEDKLYKNLAWWIVIEYLMIIIGRQKHAQGSRRVEREGQEEAEDVNVFLRCGRKLLCIFKYGEMLCGLMCWIFT